MLLDSLEKLEGAIRSLGIRGGVLTDVAVHVRSCNCRLLALHFEGLTQKAWKGRGDEIVSLVSSSGFCWDVVYLNPFPGTDLISRVTFRKMCDHCLKNYRLDGAMGMGSIIYRENQ